MSIVSRRGHLVNQAPTSRSRARPAVAALLFVCAAIFMVGAGPSRTPATLNAQRRLMPTANGG
jgi:hypothetical protein